MCLLDENDDKLWGLALTSMTSLIRASTTSMTAVPKPLKFMIPHYDKMKQIYEKIPDGEIKEKELIFFQTSTLHLKFF
jgi:26S proteasome regulatory subunit N1